MTIRNKEYCKNKYNFLQPRNGTIYPRTQDNPKESRIFIVPSKIFCPSSAIETHENVGNDALEWALIFLSSKYGVRLFQIQNDGWNWNSYEVKLHSLSDINLRMLFRKTKENRAIDSLYSLYRANCQVFANRPQ